MASDREFLAPVAGFRAIVHLSLIALHAAMLTSGHLPSEGEEWDQFKGSWVYTSMQAGGIQVDLMFALSGFLLVSKILSAKSALPLVDFLRGRVRRFLPPIIVISLIVVAMGDEWETNDVTSENYTPVWMRLLATWTFLLNYVPQSDYGSLSLSLCWSCCVDIQCGAIITIIANRVRSFISPKERSITTEKDKARFVYILRYCFVAWLMISLATRALLFDDDGLNMYKLGKLNHFGNVMTDSSYMWIEQRYNHTWRTKNSAGAFVMKYLNEMYMPTHTRYGPFAVGGIMACNLYLANSNTTPRKGTLLGSLVCWVLTIQALLSLIVPCIPQGDEEAPPMGAQLFITAAIRTLASASGAFLLYRALVPVEHPMHWSSLCSALSSPLLRPIANVSYWSYLVHFRLLLELCYNRATRDLIAYGVPLSSADNWILFMVRLFVIGAVLSILLAQMMQTSFSKIYSCTVGRVGGHHKVQ